MEKLDPKAVWIFFFRFLLIAIIVFIFLASWLRAFRLATVPYLVMILFALIVILFLCYIWARLTYRFWLYELTEDTFKKEHGVIWKRYVSIPYERIQNVDIHRGILVRILGLSDLMIQTAGYAGVYRGGGLLGGLARREPEGRLPALSKEKAEELREELIKKAKGTKQGL